MAIAPLPPSVNPTVVPLAPTEAASKKSKQTKIESKRAVEGSEGGRAIGPYRNKDDECRGGHLGNSFDQEA